MAILMAVSISWCQDIETTIKIIIETKLFKPSFLVIMWHVASDI